MVNDLKAVVARVRAALMRRGSSRHEAEDLVQEAWVRLACYEGKDEVVEPEAFLMRVAVNLSIDSYRRNQRRGEHLVLDELLLPDAVPSVEATLLARERLARLVDCVADLDPKTRQIFLAQRLHGTSYIDIAREHRLSVSAVEKHVAKAMLLIARSMEEW